MAETLVFPLQLALLTGEDFPFAAIGLVHIANRISQVRPATTDDVLDFEVSSRDPRPHPRGRQITVVTTASADGTEIWRAAMTLLSRGSAGSGAASDDADAPDVPDEAPTGPQTWRLPSDLGRRYGAVSGDRNPIHLYDVTARPLGFKRHIAHGMWTHARCLAEIANRVPPAHTVDVVFKRPVRLPSTVVFGARQSAAAIDFGVSSDNGPHLLGRVRLS